MSNEAAYQISGKVQDVIVLLRGDDYSDLVTNAANLGVSEEDLQALFTKALDGSKAEAQAVGAVVHAFPGATAVPQSTIGTPLPQPGVVAAPPTSPNPGPCQHGERSFKSSQTARGQWNRWECAIPYSKDAAAYRCKAINA